MREYRLYSLVSGTNHIKGVPAILVCENDTKAIQEARERLNGLDLEVWDGARRVIRIESQQPK
jgi:hypothetical protein